MADHDDERQQDYSEEVNASPSVCPPACPRCGVRPFRLVEIGGHGQCAVCHSVIEDCCQGGQF